MATLDLRPSPETPVRGAPAQTPGPMPAAPVLAWEAPEYVVRPKAAAWYAVFGVLLALLLFIAFLMRSFLTAVVFALLGILVLLYSERPPRTARFAISDDGLRINTRRYPFRDLDAFNVVESPAGNLLLIRSRRLALPLLHLPLGDTDGDAAAQALRPHVKEDPDLRESLADLLAHRLGF